MHDWTPHQLSNSRSIIWKLKLIKTHHNIHPWRRDIILSICFQSVRPFTLCSCHNAVALSSQHLRFQGTWSQVSGNGPPWSWWKHHHLPQLVRVTMWNNMVLELFKHIWRSERGNCCIWVYLSFNNKKFTTIICKLEVTRLLKLTWLDTIINLKDPK